MTAVVKTKSWALWAGRWALMGCITGTFACLETTNMILLGACALAGASLISIEAYESFGPAGMAISWSTFAGMGVSAVVFVKQIGMMEVWAKSYKEADVTIGLKDLERRQLELDEDMGDDELKKMEEKMVRA